MADVEGLASDQSLLAARLIDSTGVLELVGFLEEQFQLQVADDELVPENLDTIANIVAYIERKTGGGEKNG
jgi:acyl carrier protein